jgi:Ca2+/Na+ antiporter
MIYLVTSSFNEDAANSDTSDGDININSLNSHNNANKTERAIILAEKELNLLNLLVRGFLKIMSTPWDLLIYFLLPKSRNGHLIWLHLVIPLLLIWNVSELELFLLEKLLGRLKSSAGFLGLTVMSWGNNTPDMFNVASAMSKGMINLALNAAIASEVHNILLGLGLPWLVYNCIHNKSLSLIKNDVYTTAISFFCVFILSFIVLLKLNNKKLNKRFAAFLITAYSVFFTLIFILYYKV